MNDDQRPPSNEHRDSAARFRLIDDEEMLREPDQEFLIDHVCSTKSLVLTHGKSGHGKSFLGLDAAFSVANGSDWYGHAVKERGPAVYIAAEGQPGLKDRIRAWKLRHGIEGRSVGVRFILEAVDPLNVADVEALRMQIKRLPERPKLIVVDTWSACMGAGGGDENSTKDTSQSVSAWRRIIEDTGATIWIVHHEGLSSAGRARGSSALKAAAETEISVSQSKDVVTVTNLKQRDGRLFDAIRLRLHVVPLGEDRDSCVLVPIDGRSVPVPATLPDRSRAALGALWRTEQANSMGDDLLDDCGVTNGEWKAAAHQKETTFGRARDELMDARYVTKSGEHKKTRYRITPNGLAYLHPHVTFTIASTDHNPDCPVSPPPTVTPRRGDGEGGDGEGAYGQTDAGAGATSAEDKPVASYEATTRAEAEEKS